MAKILIIPDVHGRDFWIEPCSNIDYFDRIIFLGDYHDPYTFQVTQEVSRKRLQEDLIPFVKANKEKVICLLGNHDGNYLIEEMSDRFDKSHKEEIASLLKELDVKLIYKEDSYLFSHSGVLPKWLELNKLSLEDLEKLDLKSYALRQVSPIRGGWNECGSCIWGDVREYEVSEKIPGLYQIFGHTQLAEKPVITDTYACLDCRKAFVLDTTTGELKSWENTSNKNE